MSSSDGSSATTTGTASGGAAGPSSFNNLFPYTNLLVHGTPHLYGHVLIVCPPALAIVATTIQQVLNIRPYRCSSVTICYIPNSSFLPSAASIKRSCSNEGLDVNAVFVFGYRDEQDLLSTAGQVDWIKDLGTLVKSRFIPYNDGDLIPKIEKLTGHVCVELIALRAEKWYEMGLRYDTAATAQGYNLKLINSISGAQPHSHKVLGQYNRNFADALAVVQGDGSVHKDIINTLNQYSHSLETSEKDEESLENLIDVDEDIVVGIFRHTGATPSEGSWWEDTSIA